MESEVWSIVGVSYGAEEGQACANTPTKPKYNTQAKLNINTIVDVRAWLEHLHKKNNHG